MADCMNFPDNIIDFIDDYSFEDSDHVYTNGSKLILSFRVKQAIEHYFQEQEPIVRCKDCKWYDEQISMCNNCGLPREQTFFCADGRRR